MYKNIFRYRTVGAPVIIGSKPKPVVEAEPESEAADDSQADVQASDATSEAERGVPQEVLDKIYAEAAQLERQTKAALVTLLDAQRIRLQAEEIKNQARKIRNDARAQADKLIADTKRESEELLKTVREEAQKSGYDDGYKDGKADGIKDGKDHIEDELAEIVRKANDDAQKTIQDAKEQTAEYFIRAEDDVVKVVMLAIEKILPQHFLDVPQVILPVVREAIKHVRDQKEIKIHVEPYSYDLILMARSEFQSMLTDGTAIIEIVSDEALKPGDCVIETPNGDVDARLSTQLNLMKSAIQSVLNR
ncbi:MAG: flagellar assembly protein FliH [Quinella sp. 1Q7]|nr:flagellar assembly protein FliH [Quinella sp. 1Q7]